MKTKDYQVNLQKITTDLLEELRYQFEIDPEKYSSELEEINQELLIRKSVGYCRPVIDLVQ